MTDQLTTGDAMQADFVESFDAYASAAPVTPVSPAPRSAEAPHWTQHPAREFPHHTGEHAPNLATLAQLRSGGRNPLLSSAKRRRTVSPQGCTQR